MKVLLVHNHFPGQFIHLGKELCQTMQVAGIGGPGSTRLPKIRLLKYDVPDKHLTDTHPFAVRFEIECRRAEQVIYAANVLKADGFIPDVTIVHPGWGESLPMRELFPKTRLLVYCEFYYSTANSDLGFDPEFPEFGTDAHVRIHLRNATNLLTLVQANGLFAPTHWQRQLFPQPFRDSIEVMHDGIDVATASPNPAAVLVVGPQMRLTAQDEVLTYVARNLEPYRGYHTFMRALPAILEKRPNAHVVIVGGAEVSYGAPRQREKIGGIFF